MWIAETLLITLLILILIILVSSLPLYLAVKLLNGKTTIIKTFLIIIVVSIISAFLRFLIPFWGILVAWVIMIWIFHEVFRLKWYKAVIAWVLWIAFILVFIAVFSALGIGFFTAQLLF